MANPKKKKPVTKKPAARAAKKSAVKKAAVKKVVKKKVVVKKPVARKAVAKKKVAAAKKVAVKKAAVKKVVARKKPTAKKAAVKKLAAKKAAVKKPVVAAPVVEVVVKPVAVKQAPVSTVAALLATLAPEPHGVPEQLCAAALKVLDERQAEDIVMVPLAGRSAVADYILIASGRAGRQIAAIADYLREAFMKLGVAQVRIEGRAEANWVLVDGGDVIVHLFRPEVRQYYDLDAVWNKRPG